MSGFYRQLPSIDRLLKTENGILLLEEYGHSATVSAMRNFYSKQGSSLKYRHNYRRFV